MRGLLIQRVRFIIGCTLLFALVLVGKLYLLQIVHGEEFGERADRQYIRPATASFDRGSIFLSDRSGALISGATLRSGYTLAIAPRDVLDPHALYASLKPYLSLTEEEFLTKATRHDDPYEEVARRLGEETKDAIESRNLAGVSLYREKWRYYPGGTLAAHTLGFVGYLDDTQGGRYGLERSYEEVLSRSGVSPYINFFAEVFSNVKGSLITGEEDGDVITSLEPSVQASLERELARVHELWSSKQSGGIIMDPHTGEIIALAALPLFNPNSFNEEKGSRVFSNPLVESLFEMGSIMKPITIAAGLDAKVITPKTTYHDKGYLELDKKKISNFDGKGRGTVDMQEVLNQSLNTGAAYVVSRLGNRRFADYLRRFGITEETGVDLPSEASPIVENLESPRDVEYATASFGQGIAMTPISTVRSLAALANRGVPPTPHVGKRVRYRSGLSREVSFEESPPAITPEAAEEVTRMLVEVVDKALLEGKLRLPHYSVAAKTGTAQIANPSGGGYYDDRFFHSFFGYFPAYDPKFIIFLYTLEPHGVKYASQTLAEPFAELTQFLINYYSIPPDR